MADNDKPNAVEDFINKYGIQVALSIILGIIGIALILWNKFGDAKGKPAWVNSVGWGLAITGGVMGVGAVLYAMSQEKKDETNDTDGDDDTPDDLIPAF